jgi:16S rRNA (cytosine1402-N4)-methyltransferase
MKNLECDNFLGVMGSRLDMRGGDFHVPVLARQVKSFLNPKSGMLFLDGTVGGGGHSALLLEAGAEVIAIDQDPSALAESRKRFAEFGSQIRFYESNFRDASAALDALGETRQLNGALFDIGVSSHQLDAGERGFSLMKDGPLDMRMSPRATQTAADVVNSLEASELANIFKQYGEEPNARRIVARIVARRATRAFKTTFDLAEAITSVSPRRGPKHPATRIFQALRIHVNDELGALREVLNNIPSRLAPGARLAVITFHSLEDRIVKVFFREQSREWIDRPEWPQPQRNSQRIFELLTPHPITPDESEIQLNPRARSAKLRVVEIL